MLQVFPFKARTGSYGSGQVSFLWLLSCRTIGDIPRTEGLTPESVSRRQQKEPLDLTFPCGVALVGDLGGPADLQFSVSFGLVPQAGKDGCASVGQGSRELGTRSFRADCLCVSG